MADQLKTSIVRIRAADGSVVGAGFLVTDRHVLTCAHVVSRSLGLADTPADAPQAEVQLDFPLFAPRRFQTARVVYWQPPRFDGRGDIAGLELDGEPPINANPMRLVIADEVRAHPLNVLSFPQVTADYAIYETGLDRLRSRIAADSAAYSDFLVYQQRLSENLGLSRQHGDTETRRAERSEIVERLDGLARFTLGISFSELCELIDHTTSGGPVWDEQLKSVVGMVVAADQQSGHNAVSTIPAEVLYLTRLIIEQERKKGIIAYVELAAHADEPSPAEANQPTRSLVKDWGLEPEFSLLEATARPEGQPNAPRPSERAKRRLESIREAMNAHPRFVLIGEPGAGKTTTTRRLACDAARVCLNNPDAPLPVLLELPRWGDEVSPAEFVHAHDPFGDDAAARLTAGDVMLFLDGLNEMGKEGPRKAKLLCEWLKTLDGPKRVIVTCRAADYVADLDLDLPTVLAEELDEPRIRKFVEQYLKGSAAPFLVKILPKNSWDREDERHLFQLARNPFLLTALIVVYEASPEGDLPRNFGALARKLTYVLWKREELRQPTGWIPLDEMEAAFARLAFAMINQGWPIDVPYQWALRQLAGQRWWLSAGNCERAAALLHAGRSASLVEVRGKQVRFYHQLIQEYFAAVRLEHMDLRGGLARPLFESHWLWAGKWNQVIIALCGIAPKQADTIVHVLARLNPYLAADCLASGIEVEDSILQGVIHSLLRRLHGRISAMRHRAATALGSIGAPAVPGLLKALGDTNDEVRELAVAELGRIGDAAAVPGLLVALRDRKVWPVAIFALGQIGNTAVPELLDTLRDDDSTVRYRVVRALRRIRDRASVSGLLAALCDQHASVRANAAEALGQIGDPAAVPGLLAALCDQHASVRANAAEALGQIGDPAAVPGLLAALRDQDAEMRYNAAVVLGQIGDPVAVPGLLEALRDQDADVRSGAVRGLGKIEDVVAVPGLIERLSDRAKPAYMWSETRVCDIAAEVLERIATPEALAAVAEWRRNQQ